MWSNPVSARQQARLVPQAFASPGGVQKIVCDYYVGNDCCNLSGSGVWVCDAGPGGSACTVSMPVGEVPRCGDSFEQEFYAPIESRVPPRFRARNPHFSSGRPRNYVMGFPSQRRAWRRALRARNPAYAPTTPYYPFPVFVPYGTPQPQTQFGAFNWPGLSWVGNPIFYRLA